MQNIKQAIVEKLKDELEYLDKGTQYSQWVLGVSIKKERDIERPIGQPIYTARVVLKTSESPFVDGVDITFTVPEDEVLINPNYYEQTPEFQGGQVNDSIKWLKGLEDVYYLQLTNPYQLEIYLSSLEDIIKEYFFDNLMEYTLDSGIGNNLKDLYLDLIQETILEENVVVEGEVISAGKYEITVHIGNKSFTLNSKAWYTKEYVIEEIKGNLLIPLIQNKKN